MKSSLSENLYFVLLIRSFFFFFSIIYISYPLPWGIPPYLLVFQFIYNLDNFAVSRDSLLPPYLSSSVYSTSRMRSFLELPVSSPSKSLIMWPVRSLRLTLDFSLLSSFSLKHVYAGRLRSFDAVLDFYLPTLDAHFSLSSLGQFVSECWILQRSPRTVTNGVSEWELRRWRMHSSIASLSASEWTPKFCSFLIYCLFFNSYPIFSFLFSHPQFQELNKANASKNAEANIGSDPSKMSEAQIKAYLAAHPEVAAAALGHAKPAPPPAGAIAIPIATTAAPKQESNWFGSKKGAKDTASVPASTSYVPPVIPEPATSSSSTGYVPSSMAPTQTPTSSAPPTSVPNAVDAFAIGDLEDNPFASSDYK